MTFTEKIGRNVAKNLAKHIDDFYIPVFDVCIYQLEKIKTRLDALKNGNDQP